ncbi:MAG: adenylate/guanylate cyclase domain-containing protein [Gammaproteobacteria bacterium]
MRYEIETWLEQIDLGQYAPAFIENDVDMSVLADLTESDLHRLGLSLGHGKKLLKAVAAWQSGQVDPGRDGADTQSHSGPQSAPIGRGEAERRQLTVMFCDLVGSTALSEALDLEEYREVLSAYQSQVARVIRQYDGYIARYMGDGLLVYFGYPQAHEDDAERAVKAGLRIVDAMRELRPDLAVELEVRIGIATGHVVVGDIVGEGASEERAVLGDTPNLAARLQALADPGSVLIAAGTRRLTLGLFSYANAGEHRLKGFSQPVEVWRVLSESATQSRFDATRASQATALVGRDSEVMLLLERWRSASDTEGQVVLLSGEPGIGKSRLVHELKAHIGSQDHEELRFQCSAHHANTAYHPFVEHILAAAGITPGASAASKLDRLERWLGDVTAENSEAPALLAALLSIPVEGRFPPLGLSPQRHKEKTIQLLCDRVLATARGVPLLVVFEDVHWADPTSIDVLSVLIDSLAEATVLALITHRPEFEAPWRGRGHLTTHSLARLAKRQAAQMVSDVNQGRQLPDRLLREIVEKTDGVPLFVEELTKAVLEARLHVEPAAGAEMLDSRPELAIPSTLQDSLVARLDRLAEVKYVAQVASAIGREFSYELLAALEPLQGSQLDDALVELEQAQLIRRQGSVPEATYMFKHALVQDAAYASLLKRNREQLHAQLATLLETQFPETAMRQPELLAHHFDAAGLIARAIGYWQQAAGLAIERSAYREALAHLNAALQRMETVPAASRDRAQELALQIARGGALLPTLGYRAPETEAAFARAGVLGRELGDDRQCFAALRGLHGVYFARADIGAAIEVAEECLALAERRPEHQSRSVAHRLLGQTLLMRGALDDATGHLEQAQRLDAGPSTTDVAPLVHGSGYRLMVPAFLAQALWLRGRSDQALAMASNALAEAERYSGAFTVTTCMFFLCWIRGWRGEYQAVSDLAERIRLLAGKHDIAEWSSTSSLFTDWQTLATSSRDEAVAVARGRLDEVRSQSGIMTPFKLALLAEALSADSVEQARAVVDEALHLIDETGERWCEAELLRVRAALFRRDGDLAAAEACLHDSLAVARAQGARAFQLRSAVCLAELWRHQDRRRDALELLAPIHGGFEEGLDTADCKRAAAVLASLSDRGPA